MGVAMKNFREKLLLLVSISFLTAPLMCLADAVNFPSPDVKSNGGSLTVTGVCGDGKIKIVGMALDGLNSKLDTFQFDGNSNSGVFVRYGEDKTEKKVDSSDLNAVICVPIGKYVGNDFRIVVASICSGSLCGESMNFAIYDPKVKKKVSPKVCNINCASKLLMSDYLTKNFNLY